jgi:hypothetical protein
MTRWAIGGHSAPLGKTKRVSSAGAADAYNELCGYGNMQRESAEAVANVFVGRRPLQLDRDAKMGIIEIMSVPDMCP